MRIVLSTPISEHVDLLIINQQGADTVTLSIQETNGALKTRSAVALTWDQAVRIAQFIMSKAPVQELTGDYDEDELTPVHGEPIPLIVLDDPYKK